MGEKKKYSTLSTMHSIVVDDLCRCAVEGCEFIPTDCHHVFEGPDKPWSEDFGLMIPLCSLHHYQLHNDQEMNNYFKRKAQMAWESKHPGEAFTKYFRKNYL